MIRTHGVTHYDPSSCFGCKARTVQFGPTTFEPHFNYAVGDHVTSQRDFEDKLRRLSDIQSERTGITHNLQPVHPSDLIHNPPPETAPDRLDHLTDIADPTLPEHRHLREQLHATQDAAAKEAARTKDLVNAGNAGKSDD